MKFKLNIQVFSAILQPYPEPQGGTLVRTKRLVEGKEWASRDVGVRHKGRNQGCGWMEKFRLCREDGSLPAANLSSTFELGSKQQELLQEDSSFIPTPTSPRYQIILGGTCLWSSEAGQGAYLRQETNPADLPEELLFLFHHHTMVNIKPSQEHSDLSKEPLKELGKGRWRILMNLVTFWHKVGMWH